MDYLILKDYGIDYAKGISRCLDDEAFYEKILALFLDDDSFDRAKIAFAAKNYSELFNCMHELKGVSGNAELSALYEAVCPLVELLRNGNTSDADISYWFDKIENAYIKTRDGIFIALNG